MFERVGGEDWNGVSPGGFEFGIQGFVYGPPQPKSVTFFLDGSALVADQYGNRIKGAQMPDGRVVLFADKPPDSSKKGDDDSNVLIDRVVATRPQFATHAQVVEALLAEGINWLAYEVRWRGRDNRNNVRTNLTLEQASAQQTKLLQEGHTMVVVGRIISCAGWPQLSYEELKKLPEVPRTPIEELRKIRDPQLRKDALRFRREVNEARQKEMAAATEYEE